MLVRRTEEKDIPAVMSIYDVAKRFMVESGNPNQWIDGYPSLELIRSDIKNDGYVITDNDIIVGVFVFEENAKEKAYDIIEGKWLNHKPYAVIHRCASISNRKGIGQFMLDWCFEKFPNVRVDTHKDNLPMKHLLEKNGYTYCGIVTYHHNHGKRMAYQKSTHKF